MKGGIRNNSRRNGVSLYRAETLGGSQPIGPQRNINMCYSSLPIFQFPVCWKKLLCPPKSTLPLEYRLFFRYFRLGCVQNSGRHGYTNKRFQYFGVIVFKEGTNWKFTKSRGEEKRRPDGVRRGRLSVCVVWARLFCHDALYFLLRNTWLGIYQAIC